VTESWQLGTVVAVSNSRVVQSRCGRQETEYLSYPYRRPSFPASAAADTLCFFTKFSVWKRTILLRHAVMLNIAYRFVVEFRDHWKTLKLYKIFIYIFVYVLRFISCLSNISRCLAMNGGIISE
jgi:hypothetical protein